MNWTGERGKSYLISITISKDQSLEVGSKVYYSDLVPRKVWLMSDKNSISVCRVLLTCIKDLSG